MALRDVFVDKFGTSDPVEICKKLAADTVRVTRRIVREVKRTVVRLCDIKVGTEKTVWLSKKEIDQIWTRYHKYHPDSVDLLWDAIFKVA